MYVIIYCTLWPKVCKHIQMHIGTHTLTQIQSLSILYTPTKIYVLAVCDSERLRVCVCVYLGVFFHKRSCRRKPSFNLNVIT